MISSTEVRFPLRSRYKREKKKVVLVREREEGERLARGKGMKEFPWSMFLTLARVFGTEWVGTYREAH